MNTLGSRLVTTSTPGSSCIVAFMTIRGRRPYTLSSWCTSRNESPGPAWRLSTMTGRASRAARSAGVQVRLVHLDAQAERALRRAAKTWSRNQRMIA